MKTKTAFFVLTVFLLLFFFSCIKSENPAAESRIISTALGGEPAVLDAAKASDRYSFAILDYINESLTNIQTDTDGRRSILPGLAEKWEANRDFTEWTFYLREAFWEDGVKITAHDFVYSIRRIINKESASPMAMYYDYIKNAHAVLDGKADYKDIGIEALDERTLKITAEGPVKNLDEFAASLPPQREDIVNTFGVSYGSEADKLICSGAFKVKTWTHNSTIELVKNEKFWNAKNIKTDAIIFKIINEENAVMGELQNGSIDIAKAESVSWINRLKNEKELVHLTGIDSRVLYIFMNQKDKLFSNKKIRKAVSACLDREEICRDLFDDIYKPAYGFVSLVTELDGQNYRALAGEPIKKLIEKAGDPKALFMEGLKELNYPNGPASATVTIMIPAHESSKFDEYLQQTLSKKLGCTVVIDKVESAVFKKRNKTLDYQIGFKSWSGGIDAPCRYLDLFLPGNKIVPIGWENPEYTRLVSEAKNSSDFNTNLANYKRAEEILLVEDCCIAPYANQTYNIFMKKNLKGVIKLKQNIYNLKYAYKEK